MAIVWLCEIRRHPDDQPHKCLGHEMSVHLTQKSAQQHAESELRRQTLKRQLRYLWQPLGTTAGDWMIRNLRGRKGRVVADTFLSAFVNQKAVFGLAVGQELELAPPTRWLAHPGGR